MANRATCASLARIFVREAVTCPSFAAPNMMFVDSHCHLDFPALSQRLPDVLAAMRDAQVGCALCISVSMETYPAVLALAEAHPSLYATVGIHPEMMPEGRPAIEGQSQGRETTVDELVREAQHPRILGIGETGLDYYWHKESADNSLEWQRERFRTHIRASRVSGKPLVVHTRESAADTLKILDEEGASPEAGGAGGVMHCFTETWEVAEAALALGFYLSFSGIVTFKSAKVIQDVASRCPLDRLLIETDSPFLAPVPHRGKTNEPAYVTRVAQAIADLRGVSVGEVARASTENFHALFKPDRTTNHGQ